MVGSREKPVGSAAIRRRFHTPASHEVLQAILAAALTKTLTCPRSFHMPWGMHTDIRTPLCRWKERDGCSICHLLMHLFTRERERLRPVMDATVLYMAPVLTSTATSRRCDPSLVPLQLSIAESRGLRAVRKVFPVNTIQLFPRTLPLSRHHLWGRLHTPVMREEEAPVASQRLLRETADVVKRPHVLLALHLSQQVGEGQED